MKKLLMMFCFLAFGISFLYAQGGQGNNPQAREMMKQRLKDEMKLTDVQIDSVMAIQSDFQSKSRGVRTDENMSDDQKKTKMDVFNVERKARLKGSLSDEQILKLDAWYDEMRKARQNRPAGKK